MIDATVEQTMQLAGQYYEAGRLAEAEAACRRVLDQQPELGVAYNGLGLILIAQKRFSEAVSACGSAVRLSPEIADTHHNLSLALTESGEFDRATAESREAIRLSPHWADAHYVYADNLLRSGDYERGWPEFEWRVKIKDLASSFRQFSQPQWTGRPLRGWTILLHGEQGFGDRFQFVRYVPRVVSQGGRVILECAQEQIRLFRQMKGVDQFLPAGQRPPAYDLQCPLMSLPLVFGTRLGSVPADVPYLAADRQLADSWSGRLGLHGNRLKVGLVWSGGERTKAHRGRSMTLSQLAPLSQVSEVKFYGLQMGPPAAEAANPPVGMELVDLSGEITDFADTAGILANLDLLISVDAAVAHLAGAMGKPVWLMLPFVPDWRWLLDRQDSPWYPTIRLFRQSVAGDWAGVVRRVTEELAKWPK